MTYSWKLWEGQIVDEKFPLHRFLGGSDHDAVFLTERPVSANGRVAIKLIPAEFISVEQQLASWHQSAQLSHRNLLRIFEHGQCQVDGTPLLYAVMEYADEDLSQILPERPLNAAECTEMMEPVLDALAYVHSQGLVHGHIKPANILASGNVVKLSSDMLQPPGRSLMKSTEPASAYDAPEVASKGLSQAADVWSIGATVVEAVTQDPPSADPRQKDDPDIPRLPDPLSNIVRNCLRLDPQKRWSLSRIRTSLQPTPLTAAAAPNSAVASRGPVAVRSAAKRVSSGAPKAKSKMFPLIAIGVAIAALLGFFVTRSREPRNQTVPATQSSSATGPASTEKSAPANRPESANTPLATVPGKGGVLSRNVPNVPASARNTIQGTVKVNVRVSVDSAGNVTATTFQNHGPSQYFAGLARNSASEWKFAPPQVDGRGAPSQWVLRYEFRRGGTTVTPVQETP